MKRTRLLLIATGVLLAMLPVLVEAGKPEVQKNCAPDYLKIDFAQVRDAVLSSPEQNPSFFDRFPFTTGSLEVLGASRTSGPPFVELLVLLRLSGIGNAGVYLANLTSTNGARWQLASWKHSTNLKRFDASPSTKDLALAVQRSGIGSARVCSDEMKRAIASLPNSGEACDPTRNRCKDSLEVGRKIFLRSGCPTCHTTDGSPRTGPSLKNLVGRTVTFTDDTALTRDRAYLRQSVLDPTARIVKGFLPGMSSFRDRLDERELAQLLHYLESL